MTGGTDLLCIWLDYDTFMRGVHAAGAGPSAMTRNAAKAGMHRFGKLQITYEHFLPCLQLRHSAPSALALREGYSCFFRLGGQLLENALISMASDAG